MKNFIILTILSFLLISCDYIPLIDDGYTKDEAYYAIKELSKSFENLGVQDTNIATMLSEVPPFNFSTSEIEQHEGCTDYLVYPGGQSGPTISCGLDLGNIGRKNAEHVLQGIVSEKDFNVLISATYFKGFEAEIFVKNHKKFKITKHQSILICNRVKQKVWQHALAAYPNIENAPNVVKKAVLSQCILSGAGSERLKPVAVQIENGNWYGVADAIAIIRADMVGGPFERIWKEDQKTAMIIKLTLNPPKNRKKDYD